MVVWKVVRQMGRMIAGGRRSRPVNVCGAVLTVLCLRAPLVVLVVADQDQGRDQGKGKAVVQVVYSRTLMNDDLLSPVSKANRHHLLGVLYIHDRVIDKKVARILFPYMVSILLIQSNTPKDTIHTPCLLILT